MTEAAASVFLRQVTASVALEDFLVQRLVDDDYKTASRLLAIHAKHQRLRTLDALHLATALRRREWSGVDYFVSADLALSVARLKGFATIEPGLSETT